MGEPATPTPAERAATLELARSILTATINDDEPAFSCPRRLADHIRDTKDRDLAMWVASVGLFIFQTSQLLIAETDRRAEIEQQTTESIAAYCEAQAAKCVSAKEYADAPAQSVAWHAAAREIRAQYWRTR